MYLSSQITTPEPRFELVLVPIQGYTGRRKTTTEDSWKGIGGSLNSTRHKVLGRNKHHYKKWISIESLDKIQERKNKKTAINNSRTITEKVKVQAECTEANEQVERSIRADRQKHMEELATTAEKAAREGNSVNHSN
ncbi:unnamed protein product [Schistosoma margrebowiei]|uniref:Uncharacterized protein n=1 Tax=Schistosoma margrebowiei TaxID=48269 RepID=A0A183LP22_9TREM|nr:unnamed protein product [Schistosoma margrebowiei]